jgi:hypothetical protein
MAFDRLQASPGRKPHSLDHLPLTSRYAVRVAEDKELPELAALAERHIPGITHAYEAAKRVRHHHSESIFVVYRDRQMVGGVAALYLNRQGFEQLRSGALSFDMPAIDCLTKLGSEAVAIYAWVICLPTSAVAIGNIMPWLQRPLYRHADLYANQNTSTIAGSRFQRAMGFVETETPGLWVYRRGSRVASKISTNTESRRE